MKLIIIMVIILSMSLSGCSLLGGDKDPLDPQNPITVTLWHYYSGHIKDKFDELVWEFNETVGVERGVVVDAKSLGDVQQLADAVFDSANRALGSNPMPDIFAAYADNAYRVHKIVELVALDEYFSEGELKEYRAEFLEEGRFSDDNRYRIVPVAKSSENIFINRTYWEPFAREHGFSDDSISTWEGLVEVAKVYYESTGKGFFGIDAVANYMLVLSMQRGQEMYNYGEAVTHNFDETLARYIWEYYYIPYINGYFIKTGRFSSDDAKTGTLIAYTGSTAGSAYFPKEVTFSQDEIVPITPGALPYPYAKDGVPFVIQQGAGMCIVRSDKAHEYGAALFLKWFTSVEQNVDFAVSTGYLPVKNDAISLDKLLEAFDRAGSSNEAVRASLVATSAMFEEYSFYNNKPFIGSYEMRILLESHLFSKITRDLEVLARRISQGESRNSVIDSMISEEQFRIWYDSLLREADLILR